jgi:hypothetical protein
MIQSPGMPARPLTLSRCDWSGRRPLCFCCGQQFIGQDGVDLLSGGAECWCDSSSERPQPGQELPQCTAGIVCSGYPSRGLQVNEREQQHRNVNNRTCSALKTHDTDPKKNRRPFGRRPASIRSWSRCFQYSIHLCHMTYVIYDITFTRGASQEEMTLYDSLVILGSGTAEAARGLVDHKAPEIWTTKHFQIIEAVQ